MDDRARIVAVVLVGDHPMRAAAHSTRVSHHARVAVRRALLGVVARVIDGEFQQRGYRFGGIFRANQHRGDVRSAGSLDENVVVDGVAPAVIVGIERTGQGAETPIGIERQVCPNQIHRVRLSDAVSSALLIE